MITYIEIDGSLIHMVIFFLLGDPNTENSNSKGNLPHLGAN